MKNFLRFVFGWFFTLFFFALVCWVMNLKTMSYIDCLAYEPVQWFTLGLGWITGSFWALADTKNI
jgi:hypothetical protein